MESMIRNAVSSDIQRITEIYNWAVENTTASFDINPQTIEQRQEWFSHYGGRHPLIVCETDGVVAGYASLSAYRPKEGYKDTCELSVYVDPRYHGKGIGKKLMKSVVDLGREYGYHVIMSGITAGNDVSIKMHLDMGFKLCGHMKEVGYKFGRFLDCLFYQLLL